MQQSRRQFIVATTGASVLSFTGLASAETTQGPDIEHTWESADELDDWEDEGWGSDLQVSGDQSVGGSQSTLSTVPDGSREGPHYHRFLDGIPESAHLRYYVYLPSDCFPANDHFKLPGLAGIGETGRWPEGGYGGTETNGSNGWSARLEVHDEDVGPYYYHADMDGYGDWESAGSVSWDSWVQIDEYVELNAPGRDDGVIKLWVDGEAGAEITGLRFRDDDAIGIESVWHSIHHGGSADVKLPEMKLWLDHYQVWIGREVPPDGRSP